MKKILLLIFACNIFCTVFSQYVGIGNTTPLANLDVARGTSGFGTAMFRGTTYISHFNYSTTEDTYIRGGKNNSNVILNDVTGNVGVGINNPAYKLDVGGRMRLRSEATGGFTAGIWFNNYDNTQSIGFIGEVGNGAPNHLGIYGSTSGWSLVMNTLNGNVGIGTYNTNTSPSTGKLNIYSSGHAIKLLGDGQYISFYDAGNNYKGYIWNPGNNIEIGTDGTNSSGEINLKVRGIQGLTVLSDGRVKVGNLACNIFIPGGNPRLSVFGSVGIKKAYGDQAGEWAVEYGWPGIVDNNLRFYFNGGLKAFVSNDDGSWETFSDIRLKENFQPYKTVLDGIKKLKVLTYHYKIDKTGSRSFGLVAQNVQQFFPEIVSSSGPDNLLGMDYSKTGVLAIKAIQEQQVIIQTQQRKIEELEKRLAEIEKKLSH